MAAAAAASAVASTAALAQTTLPDLGVDVGAQVDELATNIGPDVTKAVGLGMALFGVYLAVRSIKKFVKPG